MNKIIEVNGLNKHYGSNAANAVHAVRDLSFYVEAGKLFAFLGPNGAGKSTTIDIICTFLQPDAGSSVIVDGKQLGRDDNAIRRSIGVVFQDNLLDNLLTVNENLRARGGLSGLRGRELGAAIDRVCEETNISDFLKRPYGKLSGGQRRRADIARALLHRPKILFLDEPTTGLDPQTRQNMWETIQKLQRETGMTIFMTTHYMQEAAGADYVIIIDEGKIAARGTPAALRETYAADKLVLVCGATSDGNDSAAVARILEASGHAYSRAGNSYSVNIPSTLAALPIIEACRAHIAGFEVMNGTMDDAFIAVTGKEIRE